MSDESTVILGLGSNVGDRLGYLDMAVSRLSVLLRDMRCSRIVESSALLPKDAPKEWDMPYLNMAVGGLTDFSASALLEEIKIIEHDIGRQPRDTWGPREIDIDILAMGDTVLEDAGLAIPHCELLNRDFALLPLIDIAPQWRYPDQGKYHGWAAVDIAENKGFTFNAQLRDTGLKVHD